MEKPFASLEMSIAAPYSEVIDIVVATLNGAGWTKFVFTENPYRLQAQCSETETWSNRKLSTDFLIEIVWLLDPAPPPPFLELKIKNASLDPVKVSIKLRHNRKNNQDQTAAKDKLATLWPQLREKAEETANAFPNRILPTEHGTSRWATVPELEKEDYISTSAKDISRRLIIGTYQGQPISVPKRLTDAHTVVCGPPGSGKSRTIIIPNLIERPKMSAIVTEVSGGEDMTPVVYKSTAGYRKAHGHNIYYFNPSDLQNCTRFNPIDFITGVGDAIKYAALIIMNTTAKSHVGDQIWSQAEQHLLTSLLLYVWGLGGKTKSVEGGKSNLGYVRSLLSQGPLPLEKLIKETGIKEARTQFSEFIRNSSPNFRLGVFSGLIQRLNPWLNPLIWQLTEVSDFTVEQLQNELFTFYLAYSINRDEYRPIMALAINFLLNFPLSKQFKYPLNMLLDEFAAYGYIPRIDLIQAVVRNREIPMVFGFQDLAQLKKTYSMDESEIIFNNTSTKIVFATSNSKTADMVSKMLGPTTKEKKSISSSGGISRSTFGSPLMTPAEVARIPDRQVLVLRNKTFPFIADTCEYGAYSKYESDYPPPVNPPRAIKPDVIDAWEFAAKPAFDEAKASQQIEHFKKIAEDWQSKAQKFSDALEQQLSEAKLQKLKEQKEKAEQAYKEIVPAEAIEALDKTNAAVKEFAANGESTNPLAPYYGHGEGEKFNFVTYYTPDDEYKSLESAEEPPDDESPFKHLYDE